MAGAGGRDDDWIRKMREVTERAGPWLHDTDVMRQLFKSFDTLTEEQQAEIESRIPSDMLPPGVTIKDIVAAFKNNPSMCERLSEMAGVLQLSDSNCADGVDEYFRNSTDSECAMSVAMMIRGHMRVRKEERAREASDEPEDSADALIGALRERRVLECMEPLPAGCSASAILRQALAELGAELELKPEQVDRVHEFVLSHGGIDLKDESDDPPSESIPDK